jgi:glycosyltransferase involved in cell wall biosynthesis
MPNVSILIPCYNAERWVGQAIQSALDQTHADKEVIVVDDGSTDGSLDVIRSFGDRIRCETGPNRGGNVARNRLLELAGGDWLQYLDADDYLEPSKIAAQVEAVENSRDIDVIYGPITQEIWRDCVVIQRVPLPISAPHDPWVLLARWYLPQTGAPLWRRQAVVDVGAWKADQPCCQEHELYLRLLLANKRFQYSPTGGAVYRQWSDQTVCKKNLPEVHRRRMAITDDAESYLNDAGRMTFDRQYAINMGRFEIARSAWRHDREFAMQIVRKISSTDQRFVPSGNAAPKLYRIMLKAFGFPLTETIATWRRSLVESRS